MHSFTNLLNAYVRCGDVAGAEAVWQAMQEKSSATSSTHAAIKPTTAAAIAPNVVTCTTLIKGYCEEGTSIIKAKEVFMRMLQQSSADISDIMSSEVSPSTASASTAEIAPSRSNMQQKKTKKSQAQWGINWSTIPATKLQNSQYPASRVYTLWGCYRCP